MAKFSDSAQQLMFAIAISCVSHVLIARDRFLGRIGRHQPPTTPRHLTSRHSIPSGNNVLDAVMVRPAFAPARASLLICHGIGEVVEHWPAVQQLLASNGVASLVFDYSGYGRSSGFTIARHFEEDAIAAFKGLQTLTPYLPVSILGFSMGSGVAAAIVQRIPFHRLVLCAAFTSLRDAACQAGLPGILAFLVPPIWRTQQTLSSCPVPVLIVHGQEDQVFPSKMAAELKTACANCSELVIVPKLSHNGPFYIPEQSYWGLIVARFLLQDGGLLAPKAQT